MSPAGDKLPAPRRRSSKALPDTAVAGDAMSVAKTDDAVDIGVGAAIETVYEYTDPDIGQIGQGGSGSMAEIPQCPVCFAYGGGGHGGGCPNAGKDPADWVTDPPPGWLRPGEAPLPAPLPAEGPVVSTEDV